MVKSTFLLLELTRVGWLIDWLVGGWVGFCWLVGWFESFWNTMVQTFKSRVLTFRASAHWKGSCPLKGGWSRDFPPDLVLKYHLYWDCFVKLSFPSSTREVWNTGTWAPHLWRDLVIFRTLAKLGTQAVNGQHHVELFQAFDHCKCWLWSHKHCFSSEVKVYNNYVISNITPSQPVCLYLFKKVWYTSICPSPYLHHAVAPVICCHNEIIIKKKKKRKRRMHQ